MSQSPTRYIYSTDGTRLAAYEDGSGPPLLLVYGALAEVSYWRSLIPLLQDRFHTIRLERRGRGLSGNSQPYDLSREVEDVIAAIESAAEPCNVFGHSSGAILSLLAASRTDNVRRLILYEPPVNSHLKRSAGFDPFQAKLRPKLEALLAAGDHASALEAFLLEGVRAPKEAVQRLKEDQRWQDYLALANTTLYDSTIVSTFNSRDLVFDDWSAETLLLAGDASPKEMVSGVEALARALPKASFELLENEGPSAVYTAPELIAKTITRFCL